MEINNVYCIDNLEFLKQLEDESVDLIYCDILYNTGKKFKDYDDNLGTPQQAIEWYRPRLIEMKRILRQNGNIVLQCDSYLSHYLKVEMDVIFNNSNFKNEIIWLRTNSGKTTSKNLANDLDRLIWYSKSKNSTFNEVYKPLSESTWKSYNRDDGDGRGKYCSQTLSKPSNPTKGTIYDFTDKYGKVWKCPKTGWRMIESKLREMENDDRLIYTGKTLRAKSYWNERKSTGRIANNLWEDINNITSSKENIGYTTQKPKALLKRIIEMLSNEGDVVADFFMGSGTTMVVAKELNRKYIGCDINPRAVEITEQRLKE